MHSCQGHSSTADMFDLEEKLVFNVSEVFYVEDSSALNDT